MSKIIFLSLLFVISCVPNEEKAPDSTGKIIRYEPLMVSSVDAQRIKTICYALAAKEDILNVLVSSRDQYQFGYTQKNCDESSLPSMKDVLATITGFAPYYSFQTQDNASFGFPNVETTSQGIMSEICELSLGGKTLMSPMQTRTGAIWFTSTITPENCRSDNNGYCIHVQRGSPVDNYNYKIHTNDWMKVNISGNLKGFYTERKLISTSNCPKGKTFEKRAILR